MNQVILRPLVTEKSMSDVSRGKYTFAVAPQANKQVIKQAIKDMFSVTVTDIATSTVKGRSHRVGMKRQEVKDRVWKKATITVKKGQKIALFEPGGEENKK